MGGNSLFNQRDLDELLISQQGVISRRQAIACAVSDSAIRYRLQRGRRWTTMLPGVYLAATGGATDTQRRIAALLYAGPGSAITGPSALAAHGIQGPDESVVDVLIPAEQRRHDFDFVRVRRTSRMPAVVYSAGLQRFVPPARAVADTARLLPDIGAVRTVVAAAVQGHGVTVADLAAELRRGPMAGSARLRAVLAETAEGVRSAAEGELRALIKRAGLPDPLYNPRLFRDTEFIAMPDAWWPDAAVAVEVDSREWHFSPRDLGADDGAALADERTRDHRPALSAEPDPRRAARDRERDKFGADGGLRP
ncbi:MAG: type IV toxin-antitoxin system AbiEi family antitoxin domain-containing protein [Streptosporangiaceae bacterium]